MTQRSTRYVLLTEVPCPHPRCGAGQGRPCQDLAGRPLATGTHAVRQHLHGETMRRAFHLVNPAAHAQELARRGLISQEAADAQDWRGEIACTVTLEELEAHQLTIQNVIDSVAHMTATVARVTPATIKGEPWITYIDAKPGFLVLADGYRKGPAGP